MRTLINNINIYFYHSISSYYMTISKIKDIIKHIYEYYNENY
jgi:hypothetical protein